MKRLSPLLLLSVLCLFAMPGIVAPDQSDIITQARAAYNAARYNEVITLTRDYSSLSDGQMRDKARHLLAYSYYRSGQLDQAYTVFLDMADDGDSSYRVNGVFLCGFLNEKKGDIPAACQFISAAFI